MPSSLEANHNLEHNSWRELNELSDEELVRLLLGGRHDGLVVLYDRYSRLLFKVAVGIVRDPGEAEEVVQTVFLEAFRGLANFDEHRGTLKVWLMQYAYCRALNRKRHLTVRHFYSCVSLDSGFLELSSFSSAPDAAECSQLLELFLSRLGPRKRKVIELTYFEGLSAEEISDRLKLSVDVVRHELYRGLAKLRQAARVNHKRIQGERNLSGKEALTPDAQVL